MRPIAAAALGFGAGLACATVAAWLVADRAPVTSHSVAAAPASARLPEPDGRSVTLPAAPLEPPAHGPTPSPLRAESQQAGGEPIGILVYGSVQDEAGRAIDEETGSLEFVSASGASLWTDITSGSYSRVGLSPGAWTVRSALTHYKPSSQSLVLTAEQRFVRSDIVLGASHRVVVRAFAPDGRPLDQAMKDGREGSADLVSSLAVIASLEPLQTAPKLSRLQWGRWGIGRFWLRGDFSATMEKLTMPDDCLGVLELEVASSAWAHLMLGSALLASQPVLPDSEDIVFTVAPQQLALSLGSLSVRCLDGKARAPIEGAEIQIRTQDMWRTPEHTGPDGRWRRDGITPGTYLFTASTNDSEHLTYEVDIPPGVAVDVGDVILQASARLSGTVVDREGQGVPALLRLRCLDQDGPWPLAVEFGVVQTDPQGAFAVEGLGPHRYVLTVADEEHARHAVFVDLRGGDKVDLSVVVIEGVTVSLDPDWPAHESHRLRVSDGNGFIIGESDAWKGDKPFVRRLEPGRYTVVDVGADGIERQQTFEVGASDLVVALAQ